MRCIPTDHHSLPVLLIDENMPDQLMLNSQLHPEALFLHAASAGTHSLICHYFFPEWGRCFSLDEYRAMDGRKRLFQEMKQNETWIREIAATAKMIPKEGEERM